MNRFNLPDLIGVGGLLLLAAGIWLAYGLAPAMMAAGGLLLVAAIMMGRNHRRARA